MLQKLDKQLIQVFKRSNEISLLKLNSQKEIPVFTFSGFHKHGPLIQNIKVYYLKNENIMYQIKYRYNI